MTLFAGAEECQFCEWNRNTTERIHTKDSLWLDESWSIVVVEICNTFTSELEMLALVFSDWYMSCSVQNKLVKKSLRENFERHYL